MDRVPLQRGVVDLGHSVLDTSEGQVPLTTMERDLLAFFAAHPSEDIPRTTLLTEVWGYHPDVRTRALDTAIKGLRRKVERTPRTPRHILTVWGFGYRFEPLAPPEVAPSEGFVGRSSLLTQLRATLTAGGCVVLTGPGGVGKTRLAREVVRAFESSCFVALAPLDHIDQVPAAVARALPPSDRAFSDRLQRLHGPLVLDNAEHLGHDVDDLLSGWLEQAPTLAVIVTSRLALRSHGCVAIPPLDADERVALASHRLHQARLPNPPAPAALQALAQRLDGLPLAIELVCARATVLGLETLIEQAEHLLAKAPDPSWSSLDDTVERSLGLLNDEERDALQRCALWRGPFRATDVLPAAQIDTLLSLERASLLHPEKEAGHLALLPTIRDVVRRRLPADEPMRRAHTERVLAAASSTPQQVEGRWIPDLLDRFTDDALAPAAIARAGILVARAARQAVEGVLTGEHARRVLAHAEATSDPVLLADAHIAAMSITNRRGEASWDQVCAAVAAAEASGDPSRLVRALGQQGSFLRLHGRLHEARAAIDRGLAVAASLPQSPEHALLWGELGLVRRGLDDMEGARQALERAVTLAEPEGDLATWVATVHRLGTTLMMLGRFEAARVWLDQGTAVCREHGLAAAGHQVATTRCFVDIESGRPVTDELFETQDATLVTWFHQALNHAVRCLLAIQANDLATAASAAAAARATCGEHTYGPAWAYALLVDGIWRLVAGDPGAADALRASLACDDHGTRVYADGYLAQADPTHIVGPHPTVQPESIQGRFLAAARPEGLGDAPSWGLHARLIHRIRHGLSAPTTS